jgi:hypothetical protein
MAKAIAAQKITDELFYCLDSYRPGSPKPTLESLAGWEPLRAVFGEILLAHLDAYDQKET